PRGADRTRGRSRVDAMQHARERDALAQVLHAAQPRERALEAEPESAVRHAAVAPQVGVPAEGLLRQVLLRDPRPQRLEVVLALGAADDLAVTLARDHVDAERQALVGRIALHV